MTEQKIDNFKKSPKLKHIIMVVGVVLFIGVIGVGGYFAGQLIHKKFNSNSSKTSSDADNNKKLIDTYKTLSQKDTPSQDTEVKNSDETAAESITWNQPEEISSLEIFEKPTNETGIDLDQISYFKVGEFKSGLYKNGEIVLVSSIPEGPSFYPSFYRFVKQDNKLFLLKKYSDELFDGDGLIRDKFTIDENTTIKELDFPESFSDTKTGQTLKIDQYVNTFFDINNVKIIFTDEKLGNVYTTKYPIAALNYSVSVDEALSDIFKRNGFYIKAADGTVRVYKPVLDFVGESSILDITWNDGSKNTNEYAFTDIGGCGSANYISVIPKDTIDINTELKPASVNSKQKIIYEFTDSNNAALKSFYENRYTVYEGKKVSYKQFIDGHPIFFWVDPFGRLIKFENNKFLPQAECGKPVIYLYPQRTTDVSVKVAPQGGLIYTEPDYNNGWVVKADTQSNLIDLQSGKTYPYLFWEGKGAIYQQPKKGFVVAQEQIHSFLIEKLARLGLNQKEIQDFLEFWEPKMQDAPYYFVTFLGNREMDQIAPLLIEPKPDTVIRILMDFAPLEKKIEVEGYDIKTPPRNGFTAVEWGGVLR